MIYGGYDKYVDKHMTLPINKACSNSCLVWCVHWLSNSVHAFSCKRSPIMRQTPCQLCILSTLNYSFAQSIWLWRMWTCIMLFRSCPIYIYMLQVRINLCIFVLVSEFETLTHTHDVHKQWQWDIWYPKWFPISSHSKYPYPFKFTNILQYVHPNLEANQPK